jgi:hypothetical protein
MATHLPAVVDPLMATQLGSFAIDMLWLGGGLIFWWPVVVGTPGGSQLRELAKVGYLGLQLIAMKPVFVYLTFSRFPQYATYELAPRVSSISARADQQMAGLLMEVAGMIIILHRGGRGLPEVERQRGAAAARIAGSAAGHRRRRIATPRARPPEFIQPGTVVREAERVAGGADGAVRHPAVRRVEGTQPR